MKALTRLQVAAGPAPMRQASEEAELTCPFSRRP